MPQECSHYVLRFPAHRWAIVLYITDYSISLPLVLLFTALGTTTSLQRMGSSESIEQELEYSGGR